jgi:hypothetical protein
MVEKKVFLFKSLTITGKKPPAPLILSLAPATVTCGTVQVR